MLLPQKASNYQPFTSMNDQGLVLETSLKETCKQLFFFLAITVIFFGLCSITWAAKGDWKLQAGNGDLIKVMRERLPPEIELEGCSGLYLHILASTLCV